MVVSAQTFLSLTFAFAAHLWHSLLPSPLLLSCKTCPRAAILQAPFYVFMALLLLHLPCFVSLKLYVQFVD